MARRRISDAVSSLRKKPSATFEPSTPPGTSPMTSTTTRVPSGCEWSSKRVVRRGPRMALVANSRGGSKSITSVSLSSDWPSSLPRKTAREPRQTAWSAAARRPLLTDTFHSGSRSGVQMSSNSRSAVALMTMFALRLRLIRLSLEVRPAPEGIPPGQELLACAAFGSRRGVDLRFVVGHDAVRVDLVHLILVAPGHDGYGVVHVLVGRDHQVANANQVGLRCAVVHLTKLLHACRVAQVRPIQDRDRAVLEHVDPSPRSEEHTSELQSRQYLVCSLL